MSWCWSYGRWAGVVQLQVVADDSKFATKARCHTRQRAKASLRRKVSMPKRQGSSSAPERAVRKAFMTALTNNFWIEECDVILTRYLLTSFSCRTAPHASCDHGDSGGLGHAYTGWVGREVADIPRRHTSNFPTSYQKILTFAVPQRNRHIHLAQIS